MSLRAAVVYRSRSGRTRQYAEAIGAHLRSRGVETSVSSIGDCDMAALADVDLLLLGAWTNGLFVVMQHPDRPWVDFAHDLPPIRARVGLFTTYQLATGSMFSRMRDGLRGRTPKPVLELKSRDGRLSDRGRAALDEFVAGN
jgi:flavodoxin